MKITKKVLGVILALAMLANVFAMFSFAVAPDSAIDLTMTVDKEYYSAGDEVVITVSEKVIPEVGDMTIGGCYAIGYNSSVIEILTPGAEGFLVANLGFVAMQGGYDDGTSSITNTEGMVGALGDTIDSGYGWDSVTGISVGEDYSAPFDATAGVDLFSFKMKLADDVPSGDYVIGFNKGSYINLTGFSNDATMVGVYGYDDDYGYGTTANYSLGTVTIHVGEPSIVNIIKNQIRFGGITSATTTRDNYTNTFAVRTIAKISTDDFTAKFGTEDQAKAGITHVGFVYALNTNVDPDNFDAATAAAVAQGTPATGYVQRDVTYIQRVADGYQFTCLVEVPDENKTDGYKALAYVCFNDGTEDHWYFSSDVATVDFTTIFNTYWAQVPVA